MKVRYMTSRMLFGLLLGLFSALASAASTTTSTSTTTSWQLPAGYYTPAKMSMTLVFPRPDSETNTWARQRIAYADGIMQYRIPVTIQGGAYPFHYQIVSGPSGMAIGQDYGDANYGIITWTPSANIAQGTTYPVDVKVTDQDGNSIEATWSVTVNNSDFVFIDPNSSTNGTNTTAGPAGSKANPFNTLNAVKGSSTTASPYTGKAIIFRGGTTSIGTGYNMGTYPKNPAVFLGYTGDIANGNYPTIDMSTGVYKNWGQPDVYFGQLKLENATATNLGGETDTVMYFDNAQANNRITFFENTFYNLQWYPGSGNSNQGAIVTFNPGSLRHYFTIVGNTIDNFNTALTVLFAVKYGVIADNKMLTGSTSGQAGIWVKADTQNISVRNNESLSKRYAGGAVEVNLQDHGLGNDQIEISYNTFLDKSVNPLPSDEKEIVYSVSEAQILIPNPRIYVYRNTVLGGVRGYDFNRYTAWLENNVMVMGTKSFDITSGTYRIVYASNITSSAVGNLYGTPGDGYIDQNGMLTGTYASQYRGKIGSEIGAGYTPLSAPSWGN